VRPAQSFPLLLYAHTSVLRVGNCFDTHEIIDAEADIRDLDVGDINDMESDLPPHFLEEQKRAKVKMPSLQDMMGSGDPTDFAANAQGGMQMTFATLTQPKSEELGKEGTDKLASQWKTMLETGGVNAQCYAVDPGKILFVTNGPGLLGRVKEFVLQQPETDWFEYQQKRSYPEGRTAPLMDHEERKTREIELGWRKPDAEEPKKASKKKDGKKKAKKNKAQ
jgi:hypothetical protein